jgi:hypothetical protein
MLTYVFALESLSLILLNLSGNKGIELFSLCCLLTGWSGWWFFVCWWFLFICLFCQGFAMYHRLASNSQSSFLCLLPLPPSAGITSMLHNTQPGVGFISCKCRICNGQHK